MNPNLVIIGTRDRPHNAERAFGQLKKVSVKSDFLIVINEDQVDLYPDIEGVMRELAPHDLAFNGKLNYVAPKYWDAYETITAMGDDSMAMTHGWDSIFAEPIRKRGYGISYSADGLQNENLPSTPMISSNIVKALGFYVTPVLYHLYGDNFWKALGQTLGALDYFPDVMMEHLHPFIGKAPIDDQYLEFYKDGEMEKAFAIWSKYLSERFSIDLERVKLALAG